VPLQAGQALVALRYSRQSAHEGDTVSQSYAPSGFGGLVVSMLASGTQVHGFAPGRSRQIFRAKNSSACLPSEGN
jgi:hypothetical protein